MSISAIGYDGGEKKVPRVFRRTPESEKAAIYGYKDLLKDSISLSRENAGKDVKRMTSGGMSDEEVLDLATAPLGGMLKVVGTGKLLAGLLQREARVLAAAKKYHPEAPKHLLEHILARTKSTRGVFKEALKIPEKEYGRIKNIKWGDMAGQPLGTRGFYDPLSKEIQLRSDLGNLETIWHEFTHARQFNPEWGAKLPGGGSEETASYSLRTLLNALAEAAEIRGMSGEQFYKTVSPLERHARGVSKAAVKFPRDFSTLYKYGLKNELAIAKKKLEDF